jgi:hypothetical protein
MKRATLLFTIVALMFVLSVVVPVVRADVTIGLPASIGSGNCFPFGSSYSGEYQQVYTASAFSGPITVTGLGFFNTQTNSSVTAMPSGTWTISLSTTSADWNSLSTNPASNIGANNTQVFSGNLAQPWSFGNTLAISLTTPFTYDPSKGNLLMDVSGDGSRGRWFKVNFSR